MTENDLAFNSQRLKPKVSDCSISNTAWTIFIKLGSHALLIKQWLDHTGLRPGSHLKINCLGLNFVSAPYLQYGIKDVHKTLARCSYHRGYIRNPSLDQTSLRSQMFNLSHNGSIKNTHIKNNNRFSVSLSFHFSIDSHSFTMTVKNRCST